MQMKFLAVAFVLIFLAQDVSATTGYFESFGEGDATPSPDGAAWFNYLGGGRWNDLNGGWNVVCTWTGQGYSACAGGSQAQFALAAGFTATSIDWSFTYSVTIQRKTAGTTMKAAVTNIAGGGTERSLGGLEWAGTAPNANTLTANRYACTAGGGTLLTGSVASTSSSASLTATLTQTISFEIATNKITITDNYGSCTGTNANYAIMTAFYLDCNSSCGNTGTTESNRDTATFDNIAWTFAGASDTYTLPTTPLAVTGLSALVTQAWTGTTSKVELRWPLSASDPDQETGTLTYKIYVNGNFLQADAIGTNDGDGSRYFLLQTGGTGSSHTYTFWIIVEDRGSFSAESCHVTVGDAVLNAVVACGNITPPNGIPPGNGGGGLGTGNPISNAKEFFQDSWGLSADIGNWLFGLVIIGLIIGGFARISATPFMLALGALVGVGVALAFGFFPLWLLFVLIFLIIAFAAYALFERGVAAESGGD